MLELYQHYFFFDVTFGFSASVLMLSIFSHERWNSSCWCFSWNLADLNQWYVYAVKANKPVIKTILQFLNQVLEPQLWIAATHQMLNAIHQEPNDGLILSFTKTPLEWAWSFSASKWWEYLQIVFYLFIERLVVLPGDISFLALRKVIISNSFIDSTVMCTSSCWNSETS